LAGNKKNLAGRMWPAGWYLHTPGLQCNPTEIKFDFPNEQFKELQTFISQTMNAFIYSFTRQQKQSVQFVFFCLFI
jgi:hypothetical protein